MAKTRKPLEWNDEELHKLLDGRDTDDYILPPGYESEFEYVHRNDQRPTRFERLCMVVGWLTLVAAIATWIWVLAKAIGFLLVKLL